MDERTCFDFEGRISKLETNHDHTEARMNMHIIETKEIEAKLIDRLDGIVTQSTQIKWMIFGALGVVGIVAILNEENVIGQLILNVIGL